MVGLFGIGHKASPRPRRSPSPTPPPPYRENAHGQPLFATEMTTTTQVVTTTTQTTTHFFSLPLWRRRGPPQTAFSPGPVVAPQAFPKIHGGEFGTLDSGTNVASLMTDKDLPPTPPRNSSATQELSISESDRSQSSGRQSTDTDLGVPLHSVSFRSSDSSGGIESSHSAMMLAHAGLGIGLTHTIPTTISARSSSSDIHTPMTIHAPTFPPVPFASVPNSRMHRAKSFQRDRNPGAGVEPPPAPNVMERRRARGFADSF